MSGRYGGGAKCPKCGKTVYFAEEVVAGGDKWHKNCFKCVQCNKPLDSMTMAMHEGKFYCKTCQKQNFARTDEWQDPGYARDETDNWGTAGSGPKCPRCGKNVYMAEEVVGAGSKWHKSCFKCASCHSKLDSYTVASHEGEIYCKSCHKKGFGPKGYGYGGGAGTLASETVLDHPDAPSGHSFSSFGVAPKGGGGSKFGGADKCPRCGQSVYAAEKVVGAGQSWHKACFSCQACGKKLDSTTVTDKDGQIYCKACYGRQFGPKGVGFGQGAGALTNT